MMAFNVAVLLLLLLLLFIVLLFLSFLYCSFYCLFLYFFFPIHRMYVMSLRSSLILVCCSITVFIRLLFRSRFFL